MVATLETLQMQTTVSKAIAFIAAHDHFATETADGLLVTTWCGLSADAAEANGIPADDTWWMESTIFPVSDGMVSLRAVRDWLGY